jgi:hypothetical protein
LSYQKVGSRLKNQYRDRSDLKGTLANAVVAVKSQLDDRALNVILTTGKSVKIRENQRNDWALRYQKTMLILLLEIKTKALEIIK